MVVGIIIRNIKVFRKFGRGHIDTNNIPTNIVREHQNVPIFDSMVDILAILYCKWNRFFWSEKAFPVENHPDPSRVKWTPAARAPLTSLAASGRTVVKSWTAEPVVQPYPILVVSRKTDIYRKDFTGPETWDIENSGISNISLAFIHNLVIRPKK